MENKTEKKVSGIQKKIALSKELASFMGAPEATSPEVVKALWLHIKKHNLQTPTDKRMIKPDSVLAPLLGSDALHMTALMKPLNKHFLRPPKAAKN